MFYDKKVKMKSELLFDQIQALEQQGNYQEAVKQYKRLVSNSEDPRYFIAYGVCLQKLQHWEQSARLLEKGIALKPHYCEGDARLFLAESYLKSGHVKKAIRQWKRVEKMEPEYPGYQQVQNEAKKMLANLEKPIAHTVPERKNC